MISTEICPHVGRQKCSVYVCCYGVYMDTISIDYKLRNEIRKQFLLLWEIYFENLESTFFKNPLVLAF